MQTPGDHQLGCTKLIVNCKIRCATCGFSWMDRTSAEFSRQGNWRIWIQLRICWVFQGSPIKVTKHVCWLQGIKNMGEFLWESILVKILVGLVDIRWNSAYTQCHYYHNSPQTTILKKAQANLTTFQNLFRLHILVIFFPQDFSPKCNLIQASNLVLGIERPGHATYQLQHAGGETFQVLSRGRSWIYRNWDSEVKKTTNHGIFWAGNKLTLQDSRCES